MIVENMMDLCAEFMGTNDYDPTTFAETARRFEEFAEGTGSITTSPSCASSD